MEKICLGCEAVFESHSNRGKYCTNPCAQRARKGRGGVRKCETCGSPVGFRRQRYCGDECRPTSRGGGRSTAPLLSRRRTVFCAFCAVEYETCNSAKKFCSALCEGRSRTGVALSVYLSPKGCERCGTEFAGGRADRRFCSRKCQAGWNQEKRRARKRGLTVEVVPRLVVFERDGYLCHLCGLLVEGEPPVLDHVIPIADSLCPGHVWENLATAHARCNMSKNSRTRREDFALYEELKARREVEYVK